MVRKQMTTQLTTKGVMVLALGFSSHMKRWRHTYIWVYNSANYTESMISCHVWIITYNCLATSQSHVQGSCNFGLPKFVREGRSRPFPLRDFRSCLVNMSSIKPPRKPKNEAKKMNQSYKCMLKQMEACMYVWMSY